MPHSYIGNWEWRETDPEDGSVHQRYDAPVAEQCLARVDLRSIADIVSTPRSQGYGVFMYAGAVSDPHLTFDLGNQLDVEVNGRMRGLLASALRRPLSASTPLDILWELLTMRADPTGDDFAKPIMPGTRTGAQSLYLGGLIKRERFRVLGNPLWPGVREVMRLDLLAEPEGAERQRQLGWQARKYGIPASEILTEFQPLTPGTTQTESFPTNEADLGASTSQDQDWTNVTSRILDVVGGRAQSNNDNDEHAPRCEATIAGSDHFCEAAIFLANTSASGGAACRYASGAETHYNNRGRLTTTANEMLKWVAAVETKIADGSQIGDGSVMNQEADGSDIEAFDDGVSWAGPVTDTSITGGTRGGLRLRPKGTGTASEADSWKLEDLAAAVTTGEIMAAATLDAPQEPAPQPIMVGY